MVDFSNIVGGCVSEPYVVGAIVYDDEDGCRIRRVRQVLVERYRRRGRIENPDTRIILVLISKPDSAKTIQCQRCRDGPSCLEYRNLTEGFCCLVELADFACVVFHEPEDVIRGRDNCIRSRVRVRYREFCNRRVGTGLLRDQTASWCIEKAVGLSQDYCRQ